jgi:hypothetical protein
MTQVRGMVTYVALKDADAYDGTEMFRPAPYFAIPVLLLLSACNAAVEGASQAATSVRSSAERSGSRARAANDAREARILDEAVEMGRQAVDEDPQQAEQDRRYEVRRDGSSWAIYDTQTGRAVRSVAKGQTGLTQARAEQLAYDLQMQDNEERLRSAAFGLAGRPQR